MYKKYTSVAGRENENIDKGFPLNRIIYDRNIYVLTLSGQFAKIPGPGRCSIGGVRLLSPFVFRIRRLSFVPEKYSSERNSQIAFRTFRIIERSPIGLLGPFLSRRKSKKLISNINQLLSEQQRCGWYKF